MEELTALIRSCVSELAGNLCDKAGFPFTPVLKQAPDGGLLRGGLRPVRYPGVPGQWLPISP